MKNFEIKNIRNVCLLSHGSAGKTSLVETMLYRTKEINRIGKIADGTTVLDFDAEEIKRKISISTKFIPIFHNDCKINIIDTPGYFDFVGEVKQGLRVADSAIILLTGKSGVEVGTEKSWEYAKDIPKILFVNKMDEDNSNFYNVIDELKEKFGKSIAPFQVPIYEKERFIGFVNIVDMKGHKFDGDNIIDIPIPDDMKEKIKPIREMILEAVAESSEELMEKYFEGEEFTSEEINIALKNGVAEGLIVPVLCGSATSNVGVGILLNSITDYLPSPALKGTFTAENAKNNEPITLKTDKDESFSAIVFKTIADPFVGKISIFKVMSGTLKNDMTVYNSVTETNEKISHIYLLKGKKQVEVDKLYAGDIGAVTKLVKTNTNDTLCSANNPVILDKIEFPEPCISLAILPKEKGDEEKISTGLARLMEEDPTFNVSTNTETRQMLISGTGEQQIEIIVSKLKSKFGVSVDLIEPKIPYREAIRKKVKVQGKHKKQSGGHGQYGDVWIEFERGDTEDLTFEEKIFGGSVPKNYFPAVEKGLRESIVHGVLAGYPVVFLKATLLDGSYHPVDSSEMAFKLAASLAYKKGLEEASPVLLEPISSINVIVPDSYMGDVIGDLNKRRGKIMGMDPMENGLQKVSAEVPMGEMHKYATDLRSLTQGRASFSMKFERYEEAPPMVSQKVIEEAKKS